MKFAAVILAGGASRRMGGFPKALLDLGGETFLDKLIGLFAPWCEQTVVVLGHHAGRIRAGLRRDAEFVVNPDPERGQLTSLQAGFAALRPGVDQVFFTPVDYPGIRAETVQSVMAAAGDAPVVPEYNGKHGHPVLIPAWMTAEFLELPVTDSARTVIHRHAARTRYIPVEDPGILLDVDDPEAYRAIVTQAAL
ncbi:MAG: nucleotidyltransferase family protein [Bryobacteraceae bacterium]|nr:nucleotidyltransferase family protein [Bryobacteraceae bacterium]